MAQVNGIVVWTEGIKAALVRRLPKQRKTQRDKLAVLVATMLHVRSANLVELAAGRPRESDRWDMGYQWISRLLANDLVCCDTVMEPFAREILARLAETGEPIPLILDQTTASDRHQILMLSVRWGERALPLAWRGEENEGGLGCAPHKKFSGGVPRVAARRSAGSSARRPLLWNPRDDPVVSRSRVGLSAAAQGQSPRPLGHTKNHDRRPRSGRRALFRSCRPHRPAGHDQHRHHSRSRTCRALDHRHVGQAGISDHPGICRALGHRAHVLRLQIARVRPRTDSSALSRPPRPLDPGHVFGPLLGGLDRDVGSSQQSNPRRKKRPDHPPPKLARGRPSWFTRGIRRAIKLLLKCLPLPKLWGCLLN